MESTNLTERQIREREFYERYAAKERDVEVCFDPVESGEERPWNSYWFMYKVVKDHFTHPGQRLLDLGCGNGSRSLVFARIGYEVYGVDVSPGNIRMAIRLARRYGLEGKTNFSVQVAEALEFQDGFFDVVAGVDILHHVETGETIKEVRRVLKKGGVAIFREPVWSPLIDTIRNSRIGLWLFPKNPSIEAHITEDERKLTKEDLKLIETMAGSLLIHRFRFLSRLDKLLTFRDPKKPSFLEKVDHGLLKLCPFLTPLYGDAVILFEKERAGE